MKEEKRQKYLQTLGITQWKLRTDELQGSDVVATKSTPSVVEEIANENQIVDEPKSNVVQIPSEQSATAVKGMTWLNKGSVNGLLVVLSKQGKTLSPENRALMSKMLNSVHFLPSETGFAEISDQDTSTEAFTLDSIKAILVLGNEAGRQLVKIAGARIMPGSEIFSLDGRKIVISLHPEDVVKNKENKQQAWADLKLLLELFKDD